MGYVPRSLELPLFLGSRVSYRRPGTRDTLVKYLLKNRELCKIKEDENDRNITAAVDPHKTDCSTMGTGISARDLIDTRPWQLPPNRYGVPIEPFERFRGIGGAYWPKIRPIRQPRVEKLKVDWKFYEMESGLERFTKPYNRHKGIFLSNLRNNRPTSRSMVNSLPSCFCDPKEPSLAKYRFKLKFVKKTKAERPNPHEFLRNSCVPVTYCSIHKRHTSSTPGPGRYETRYKSLCTCLSKLIYNPDLEMAIEREKRLKFRGQPFKRINPSLYCTPEWRHVQGHGHKWIFMNPPEKPLRRRVSVAQRKVHLHADAHYMDMIINPARKIISFRENLPSRGPVGLRFNCVVKRTIRKQLRNNKKIAFLSGQPRFKDVGRPPILTVTKQEEAKASLPPERRLIDRPVMRTPAEDIVSKVNDFARNKKYVPEIDMRKRPFKFMPSPPLKVLVTLKDIEPFSEDGVYKPEGFYGKPLREVDFLKPGTVVPNRAQYQQIRRHSIMSTSF